MKFKSDVNILGKGTGEMKSIQLEVNKGNEVSLKNFSVGGDIVHNKILLEILEASKSSVRKKEG